MSGWILVIITAGFTQMGPYTVDRAFQTLGGPWADRAQCEKALEQQGQQQRGTTLACMWRMPPPQEWRTAPPQEDRAA
jgi:hypothetical protein